MYLFEVLFLFSSFKCPKVELLDPMGALSSSSSFFFKGSACCFQWCLNQFTLPPAVHEGFLSSNPYQHVLFLIFVILVMLTIVRWYLIMVLICISLMTSLIMVLICISLMTRDVERFSRARCLSVCLWKNACLGPLLIF